jgi:hypothetical protein
MIAIKDHVLDSGGYVFGGFVRDMIIHNRGANLFYRDTTVDDAAYSDASYHPQSLDRLVLPRDIDCVFDCPSSFELFERKLSVSSNFAFCRKRVNDAYLPESLKGFVHYQLFLSFKIAPLFRSYLEKEPVFKVDALVMEDDAIPAGEIGRTSLLRDASSPLHRSDFECNSLVLFRSHCMDMISRNNARGLDVVTHNDDVQRIIQDTVARRAVFVSTDDACEHRVRSMLKKGYSLSTRTVAYHPRQPQVDPDSNDLGDEAIDICAICHEDMTAGEPFLKRNCCQGKYHAKCLMDVVSKCTSCPMCRETFDSRQADVDYAFCSNIMRAEKKSKP